MKNSIVFYKPAGSRLCRGNSFDYYTASMRKFLRYGDKLIDNQEDLYYFMRVFRKLKLSDAFKDTLEACPTNFIFMDTLIILNSRNITVRPVVLLLIFSPPRL